MIERFWYDLEMKTREQKKPKKNDRKSCHLIDLSNEYKHVLVLVDKANARLKKLRAGEVSRNQSILLFDVILQRDWPIEP